MSREPRHIETSTGEPETERGLGDERKDPDGFTGQERARTGVALPGETVEEGHVKQEGDRSGGGEEER